MPEKPAKPSPDFPLYAHSSGQWAKKIKGQTIYFGLWSDPEAALKLYDRERGDWEAGRDPRQVIQPDDIDPARGVRLGDGCNLFLDSCLQRVRSGSLSQRSYDDYRRTLGIVLSVIDRFTPINELRPADWRRVAAELGKGLSPSTQANEITRIRVAMRWLASNRYIAGEPHYGQELKKPAKVVIRRSRANSGRKWFTSQEVRSLVAAASPAMRAMILLGVNCGFGNGDCAMLQPQWISGEWIDYDRPKTGVHRRAKLWPETLAAIAEYLEVRPAVHIPLLFVTSHGNPYSDPDSADCNVAKSFIRLSRKVKSYIPGRGFYSLRRTFETIASETKDQVAVSYIMGHVDDSMSGIYRQFVGNQRLEAIADFMRSWYLEN